MSRARGALAVALVGLGALTLAVTATSGGKSGSPDSGPLLWAGKPVEFTHPNLPNDHIVAGRLRNRTLKPLRIVARDDIRVRSADGQTLPTAAVFSQTFGRGLFNPTRLPQDRLPERELMRIGDVGFIEPGKELPLTVSWREEPGGPRGSRVQYPGGSLAIPSVTSAGR